MEPDKPKQRRSRRQPDPEQLDSADTLYTSVPKPVGEKVRREAEGQKRTVAAVLRDLVVERYGENAA